MLMKQGMFVRSNEIQRLSVGVLYLMRHGVCHNGIVILEKKEELKMLLPPESTLCEHYILDQAHNRHPGAHTRASTQICIQTGFV